MLLACYICQMRPAMEPFSRTMPSAGRHPANVQSLANYADLDPQQRNCVRGDFICTLLSCTLRRRDVDACSGWFSETSNEPVQSADNMLQLIDVEAAYKLHIPSLFPDYDMQVAINAEADLVLQHDAQLCSIMSHTRKGNPPVEPVYSTISLPIPETLNLQSVPTPVLACDHITTPTNFLMSGLIEQPMVLKPINELIPDMDPTPYQSPSTYQTSCTYQGSLESVPTFKELCDAALGKKSMPVVDGNITHTQRQQITSYSRPPLPIPPTAFQEASLKRFSSSSISIEPKSHPSSATRSGAPSPSSGMLRTAASAGLALSPKLLAIKALLGDTPAGRRQTTAAKELPVTEGILAMRARSPNQELKEAARSALESPVPTRAQLRAALLNTKAQSLTIGYEDVVGMLEFAFVAAGHVESLPLIPKLIGLYNNRLCASGCGKIMTVNEHKLHCTCCKGRDVDISRAVMSVVRQQGTRNVRQKI